MFIPAFFKDKEPRDVQVQIGGNATFLCLTNGTSAEPFWRINGTEYSLSLYPPQYKIGGQKITINNVTWTDNGVTFQCFYRLRHGSLESTVGRIISKLHVYLCWMLGVNDLDYTT